MLSEHQPYIRDFCCHCGMDLWDCEDWERSRWADYENPNGCLHRAANDPELLEIEKDLDDIIEKINRSTTLIHYYGGLNGRINRKI